MIGVDWPCAELVTTVAGVPGAHASGVLRFVSPVLRGSSCENLSTEDDRAFVRVVAAAVQPLCFTQPRVLLSSRLAFSVLVSFPVLELVIEAGLSLRSGVPFIGAAVAGFFKGVRNGLWSALEVLLSRRRRLLVGVDMTWLVQYIVWSKASSILL